MYYLIAHMIDPVAVGSVVPALPLHLTVVHWFYSEAEADKLMAACAAALKSVRSSTAIAAEEARFGRAANVPVNKVTRDNALLGLHSCLIDALGALKVKHTEPRWVRQGWEPHVTHRRNRRLRLGDEFIVDSVDLVSARSISSERTILARFYFRHV